MDRDSRNAAVAALWIMIVFGVGAYFLPTVIIAIGNVSTIAAGAFAVLFVVAFFGVFWLRGRFKGRRDS
jgi:drug/metabolite transporter (DMT)-like permease